MYYCEYCGKLVEDKDYYGSGRFCSRSCSCGWVSKNQSKEVKDKKVIKIKSQKYHQKGIATRPRKSWTDEQRINHSKIMKEVMNNPEVKLKISKSSKGKILSEETRRKISDKVKESYKDGRNKGWTCRRKQETYAEKFWKDVLIKNDINFVQEYKINKYEHGFGNGCYFLDFLLKNKIDLEIDGHQHYNEDRKQLDYIRDKNLSELGYKIYRVKFINPSKTLIVKEQINDFLEWYNLNSVSTS